MVEAEKMGFGIFFPQDTEVTTVDGVRLQSVLLLH
jgi:hypothetical protein